MDKKLEQEKRIEFSKILFDLAKQQDLLNNPSTRASFYIRLEALYYIQEKETFRHFYSDIFSVLSQIQQDSELGNINILGQNLSLIKEGYQAKNYDKNGKLINIEESIKKLYDHLNLDIARILYSEAGDWKTSGEETISELKNQMKSLQNELDATKEVQKNVENTLKNQEKEYIAILGIFASVVLTFVGGIAFSSSVLNNIGNVGIYRLLITSIIIGAVVLNILFGLFFYLEKLVRNKGSCKPLLIANSIILAMAIIVGICWYTGVVENRNSKFENEMSEVVEMPQSTTVVSMITSTSETLESETIPTEQLTSISSNRISKNETGSLK